MSHVILIPVCSTSRGGIFACVVRITGFNPVINCHQDRSASLCLKRPARLTDQSFSSDLNELRLRFYPLSPYVVIHYFPQIFHFSIIRKTYNTFYFQIFSLSFPNIIILETNRQLAKCVKICTHKISQGPLLQGIAKLTDEKHM